MEEVLHILHRMNNDLTAVTLSIEGINFLLNKDGKIDPSKMEPLPPLLNQLTSDLRMLTQICRKNIADNETQT